MTQDAQTVPTDRVVTADTPWIGNLPWSGVAETVTGLLTAEEAIAHAGLDWEVQLRKLYRENARGNPQLIRDRWATVRTDTDDYLGIVGGDYQTLANRAAFAFTTPLVTMGAAYDSAGYLQGGRKVFLTMRLEREVLVDEDPHDLYLFLWTSHDGSKSVEAIVTPMRRRCGNQDNLILQTNRGRWRVRHNTTMEARLREAQDALRRTFHYVDEFEETARRLLAVDLAHGAFRKMLEDVSPRTPRVGRAISAVLETRESSPLLDDIRPSAWGALQAWTEWTDHRRPFRSPETRLRAVTDGWAATGRNELARQMLARAR